MHPISIKSWPQAMAEAISIRTIVFVREQGVPKELELDEFDVGAQHALIYAESQCAGTARMVRLMNGKAQIGRMAVLSQYRKQGLGSQLLNTLVELGRSQGIAEFELHAQVSALGFYEKLGFNAQGEIYEEAGILHRNMILLLK